MKNGGSSWRVFIAAPLLVSLVPIIGGLVTTDGLVWYDTLILPSWTPSGAIIGAVWSTLFALTAVSIALAWSKAKVWRKQRYIFAVFAANLILNLTWSIVFFGLHDIGAAIATSVALGLSVLAAMVVVAPYSRVSAWLLLPYLLWVCFATYLNTIIWLMN